MVLEAAEREVVTRTETPAVHQRAISRYALRFGVVAAFLILWQFVSDRGIVDPFFISSPTKVGSRVLVLLQTRQTYEDVVITLREAMLGFAIGTAIGVIVGFILGQLRLLDEAVQPLLNLANTLPRVALAPLFILWFGIGEPSKVVLVFSVVVFILIFNTYTGTKTVDRDFIAVAETLGARRWQLMLTVTLPWCLPWIFAGMRIAMAWSLGGAVIGEYLAAKAGVGYRIFYFAGILDNSGLLAGCVVLLLMAVTLFAALALVERRLLSWRPVP